MSHLTYSGCEDLQTQPDVAAFLEGSSYSDSDDEA